MKNLALQRIQTMTPYTPPLSGRSTYKGLLLDFNERTRPSEAAARALKRFVQAKQLQVYPEYFDLEAQIAGYAGTEPDQIMITNGTDQAIDVIFRTFVDSGDVVVIPSPTFAMYAQYAQVIGATMSAPLYKPGSLAFPLEEVLRAGAGRPKLIVVTNPNSPTGTLVSLGDIEKIAQSASDSIVYVDEAYFEFAGVTAVDLIRRYPNVIVSRTFSKAFGLAGLRIGYVIANRTYVTEMLKVRGPYDVNNAAAYAAAAVLADAAGLRRYVREVMERAKPLVERFFAQNGVEFYPSAGNFILFRPVEPARVESLLRENGVLVRPQDKPGIEGTLRLTIGTAAQMREFVAVYRSRILATQGQKYAILDRDGTLIFEPQDTFQIDSLEKLRILDGVISGLKQLIEQGYKLVMISNQDGLGTASFPVSDFDGPQQSMLKTFSEAGITFEQVLICPHLQSDNCDCRKPKTVLLDKFLASSPADIDRSFVCGDRSSDRELATNLGMRFVPAATNGNFYQAIKEILI